MAVETEISVTGRFRLLFLLREQDSVFLQNSFISFTETSYLPNANGLMLRVPGITTREGPRLRPRNLSLQIVRLPRAPRPAIETSQASRGVILMDAITLLFLKIRVAYF